MGDAMMVDDREKKGQKRKREKQKFEELTVEEREARVKQLNEELESLCRYYHEVMSNDVELQSHFSSVTTNVNAIIAVLLEEKSASYSKLVNEVYGKLKERESGVTITIATVKTSVLHLGQRVAYGISKSDVDILEDETESSLWCWETRDMKFLPSPVRVALKVRRIARKKINERIIAIWDVVSSLQNSDGHSTSTLDMEKAAEKLSKSLSEANIRKLVENMAEKKDSEMAEKEVKRKATALLKELEKEKKKKMQSEKEKEKERKRLQQEAEKDEKRREKEESESKKQSKRKKEEAEREQRRKEKEEAELKKQRSVQKQASVMERFLKRSKTNETSQNDQSPIADSNVNRNENALESVSLQMDSALLRNEEFDMNEIFKSHINSWRRLGDSIRVNNKQHWGLRQKPKMQLIKELKLTSNKEPARDDDLGTYSMIDGWEQMSNDDKSSHTKTDASLPATRNCIRRKQLLQFDKSNRPAFYGIWPKKSRIVGPRHPQKKDPELDYDIDSDEEWEEEEPGESLSDSEKEEETLDDVSQKVSDGEESDDGFLVPDGYLSDNEGVETDRNRNNDSADVTDSSPSGKPEAESEDCSGWTRQQKHLLRLTEHALKKNQPLLILNLMHEKAQLLSSEDLSGAPKVEHMCLQALTMCAFPGGSSIELPSDSNLQEAKKEASTPGATGGAISISDSELCEIVSVINSCGQGMQRVLESLQQKFPAIPKSHMKNKVREISDFVDNRWKVKKEILNKLGMSISPDKSRRRSKSIATFFSKRCLPPAGHPCESSPESLKRSSSNQQKQPQQRENA